MAGNCGCSYEMNPCRRVVGGFEKCEETASDIAVWSVYRREWDGPACWLSDHATKEEAQVALQRLKDGVGHITEDGRDN